MFYFKFKNILRLEILNNISLKILLKIMKYFKKCSVQYLLLIKIK